ncbi:MAG: ABC transporter substrate-binding protein [Oligoflexales bacterium]
MNKLVIIFLFFLLTMQIQNIALGKVVNLGLAWAGKSGMSKRVLQGFEEEIKLGNSSIEFQIEKHPELPDVEELSKKMREFEKTKVGMVIFRSNAVKYMAKNPPTIPTFIGGNNHPGQLGAIKNINAPEGNITGVTYYIPVENQFEIFENIKPMKDITILLEEGHPSSDVDQNGTAAYCNKKGYRCNFPRINSKEHLINIVKKYSKMGTDTFILGNQSLVFDNSVDVIKAAKKIPVFSFTKKPVENGAMVGFVADDIKLGKILAQKVIDFYSNNLKIKDIPIGFDESPKFEINSKTANALGISLPYEITNAASKIWE